MSTSQEFPVFHAANYELADRFLAHAKTGSKDRPLAELTHLHNLRTILDEQTERAVRAARLDGESWISIGLALGMSRQSAWEKFAKLCETDA